MLVSLQLPKNELAIIYFVESDHKRGTIKSDPMDGKVPKL